MPVILFPAFNSLQGRGKRPCDPVNAVQLLSCFLSELFTGNKGLHSLTPFRWVSIFFHSLTIPVWATIRVIKNQDAAFFISSEVLWIAVGIFQFRSPRHFLLVHPDQRCRTDSSSAEEVSRPQSYNNVLLSTIHGKKDAIMLFISFSAGKRGGAVVCPLPLVSFLSYLTWSAGSQARIVPSVQPNSANTQPSASKKTFTLVPAPSVTVSVWVAPVFWFFVFFSTSS